MATFITSKNLCISLDPGFNATKVVINGILFEIPNAILDVTGRTKEFLELGGSSKKTGGYLLSRYVPNKEYMVGELARKSLADISEREVNMIKHDINDSKSRFETADFEVSLMTCLGTAIVKYANESIKRHLKPEIHLENPNELESFKIFIGVALPNDWVNEVWPNILKFLIGHHSYSIETESGSYNLNFAIEPTNAISVSQAQAALIGTAYDDNGNSIPNCATMQNLPAIIIDGGYKTMGLFLLTKALRVTQAESLTLYAMGDVHKEVARILRDEYGRKSIQDFMIPAIIEDGGTLNYLVKASEEDDNYTSRTVDVNKILEEVQYNTCKQLIEYMDQKFENFLEARQIIITGGTGAAYYKQMTKYFNESREFLKDKVILTDYEFLGVNIDPVYGVAVGLYKIMKNQITKALKKANLEGETIVEVTEEPKPKEKEKEKMPIPAKEVSSMDRLKNKPASPNKPVIVKED